VGPDAGIVRGIMTPEEPDHALRREFDALVSSLGLDDLASIAKVLPLRPGPMPRPELRRPPLPARHLFRVRMTLVGSKPVIWRRMDIRSDLPLNLVHLAIQAAFNWFDYHLNRFTLGGGPWDRHSQVFACVEDLREMDQDDEAILDSLVQLDETLQQPGDVLHYLYDYGDSWSITIRLEELLPWTAGAPGAWCVDGERAAPPEDCGHLLTAKELAEVIDDPSAFDLGAVNAELSQSSIVLADAGVIGALVDLVTRLRFTEVGPDVTARAFALSTEPEELDDEGWRSCLRPHQWFLERAGDDGIPLTAAGYLKPVDVMEVAPLLPTVSKWFRHRRSDREGAFYPLLEFRQSLQRIGLLRKSKGRLHLTKAGRRGRDDIAQLRRHMAERLAPTGDDPWTTQSTLLVLLFVATSGGARLPLQEVASALRQFGWRTESGPVQEHQLFRLEVLDVLRNVSDRELDFEDRLWISPAAALLARAALTNPSPR